ncbi:MAG: YbjN domain-containing protein [Caldilineaceae bacterium]|nr:YbjN domain-containing protein [Caldilineaceae bacterium]MBP8108659.1 YbjN domain-containing protein [Caldilineaceae bacterium]MBP8123204.1 YbjN domain-containing protein [Caldilineaceae bacterium]MBP9073259.1 YbjN domain-containing protein [Caldilineaceae bacterium]
MISHLSELFNDYDWHADELEPGIWRSSFATDAGGEFDLFVMAGEEWVHFAISPFTPRPVDGCRGRLFEALLILNQQMRLAHFGLDGDGDANLILDLPAAGFTFEQFTLAVDTLVHYTEELGGELVRLATEPGFHSAKVMGIE